MKFFLHIKKQVKGKNSKEKLLTQRAQILLCACLSFRLSPMLIIARRILKLINKILVKNISYYNLHNMATATAIAASNSANLSTTHKQNQINPSYLKKFNYNN